MFYTDAVHKRALEMFRAAKSWPPHTVEYTIGLMNSQKPNPITLEYVAAQSVTLAIMAGSDGKWPPMTPAQFADTVLAKMRDFHKFSTTVQHEAASQ